MLCAGFMHVSFMFLVYCLGCIVHIHVRGVSGCFGGVGVSRGVTSDMTVNAN